MLNNLPKVGSPTGTETGDPVSVTSSPLFNPSVGPRAKHLTQLFPTCCSKPATLENGINIMVPPFINTGDKIVLDTRTLEYVKKIK